MDQKPKPLIQSKLDMDEMVTVDMIDLSNAIDGEETPNKRTRIEATEESTKEDIITQWFSKGVTFIKNSYSQFDFSES